MGGDMPPPMTPVAEAWIYARRYQWTSPRILIAAADARIQELEAELARRATGIRVCPECHAEYEETTGCS